MTRVKVRTGVVNELSLYDLYDVPAGDTPEDVAFYHFGDAQLHFVILLTNNITDVYHEWPMDDITFEKYVNDKYANPNGIHHYEKTVSSGKPHREVQMIIHTLWRSIAQNQVQYQLVIISMN